MSIPDTPKFKKSTLSKESEGKCDVKSHLYGQNHGMEVSCKKGRTKLSKDLAMLKLSLK